ncbi:MAG: hypothetical protein MRK00_07205 [Nitrosomonas sp.]|nr:hypothetical protein [Nitrosomonas sp.]
MFVRPYDPVVAPILNAVQQQRAVLSFAEYCPNYYAHFYSLDLKVLLPGMHFPLLQIFLGFAAHFQGYSEQPATLVYTESPI